MGWCQAEEVKSLACRNNEIYTHKTPENWNYSPLSFTLCDKESELLRTEFGSFDFNHQLRAEGFVLHSSVEFAKTQMALPFTVHVEVQKPMAFSR